MPVYIADFYRPQGRRKVCSMIADTPKELRDMARRIRVPASYIAMQGSKLEHLDVWKSKRKYAIRCGAVSVSREEMEGVLNRKKLAQPETSFDTSNFS